MKRWGTVVLVLLGIALLGAGSLLAWAWTEDQPVSTTSTQTFRIPVGESLTQTAQRLANAGLVRSPLLFRLLFQFGPGEGAMPSGTFAVPGGMTARDAAAFFHHAQPLQVKVTVPEGWTSRKIARLLEEKQVVAAPEFLAVVQDPSRLGPLGRGLATLEGRLFPETYLFPVDATPTDVARIFLATFEKRTAKWAAAFSPEEWERRLVLASIVEREYRDPAEAPLIASVFANRLERGIPLGSCATIEYILTEIQGRPHPKRIFFVHTEIPSPYNTYLNKGLPPAAISNPGLTALEAAFSPAKTNHLFFVVADAAKGTHTFSDNWTQHERARSAYLTNFVTKG